MNKTNRSMTNLKMHDSLDNFLEARTSTLGMDVPPPKTPTPKTPNKAQSARGFLAPSTKDLFGSSKNTSNAQKVKIKKAQQEKARLRQLEEEEERKRIDALQRRSKLRRNGGGLDGSSWHGPPPTMPGTTTSTSGGTSASSTTKAGNLRGRRSTQGRAIVPLSARSKSRDRTSARSDTPSGPQASAQLSPKRRARSQSVGTRRRRRNDASGNHPSNGNDGDSGTSSIDPSDDEDLERELEKDKATSLSVLLTLSEKFYGQSFNDDSNGSENKDECDCKEVPASQERRSDGEAPDDGGSNRKLSSRERARASSRERRRNSSRGLISSRHGSSTSLRSLGRQDEQPRKERKGRRSDVTVSCSQHSNLSRSRSGSRDRTRTSKSASSMADLDSDSSHHKSDRRRSNSRDLKRQTWHGEDEKDCTAPAPPISTPETPIRRMRKGTAASLRADGTPKRQPKDGATITIEPGRSSPNKCRQAEVRDSRRSGSRDRKTRSSSRDGTRVKKDNGRRRVQSDGTTAQRELLQLIKSDHQPSSSRPKRNTSLYSQSDHVPPTENGCNNDDDDDDDDLISDNDDGFYDDNVDDDNDKRGTFRTKMTDKNFRPTSILNFDEVHDWGAPLSRSSRTSSMGSKTPSKETSTTTVTTKTISEYDDDDEGDEYGNSIFDQNGNNDSTIREDDELFVIPPRGATKFLADPTKTITTMTTNLSLKSSMNNRFSNGGGGSDDVPLGFSPRRKPMNFKI